MSIFPYNESVIHIILIIKRKARNKFVILAR